MAVRSLNVFEEHAGKIFLAAVALVAVVLAWLFVFGETVTVKVGGRELTMARVREELADQNRKLADSIKDDAPTRDPPIVPDRDLATFNPAVPSRMASVVFNEIGAVTPWTPIKEIREKIAEFPMALLAPPGQPLLQSSQGVANVPTPGTDRTPGIPVPKEIRYIVASAELPLDSMRAFGNELREGRTSLIEPPLVLELQLQRESLDEQDRPLGPPELVERFANLPPTDIYRSRPVPGAEGAELTKWASYMQQIKAWLAKPETQKAVLRPAMPELVSGPVIEPIGSIQAKEEAQKRQEAATSAPAAPEFVPPGGAPAAAPGGLGLPPGLAQAVPPAGPPAPGPSGGAAAAPLNPNEPPPIDAARDIKDWVWGCDAKVQANKRYRYRMRYVLFNPMLNTRQFKDSALALDRQVAIDGPWGPWSDSIQTERDLYYFLARGGNDPAVPVEFDVYRFIQGRWQRRACPVTVGEPLGGVAGDFATGLTPIDIRRDMEVSYRHTGADGVPTLATVRTIQVVLADSQGRLRVRSLREDMESPDYAKVLGFLAEQDKPKSPVAPGGPTAPAGPAPGGAPPFAG